MLILAGMRMASIFISNAYYDVCVQQSSESSRDGRAIVPLDVFMLGMSPFKNVWTTFFRRHDRPELIDMEKVCSVILFNKNFLDKCDAKTSHAVSASAALSSFGLTIMSLAFCEVNSEEKKSAYKFGKWSEVLPVYIREFLDAPSSANLSDGLKEVYATFESVTNGLLL